ncbi:MAG: FAD-binding oxidoreductase [Hyphomicrobiales bacterium]|nr:FAD-binding oxidoreductase [Hyphomicrobiales bacterium]
MTSAPSTDPTPLPRSYGMGTPAPETRILEGEHEAKVLVIGGGICGLSTALHLRELGHEVTVVEAGEIGQGGSGRAFGLVVPYAKRDHDAIRHAFGEDAGSRIVDAVASGPDLVFELIARHEIDCEASRNGWILGAHTQAALAGLAKLGAYWQNRGAPVECLDAGETARLVGSHYYLGALLDRRAGSVNPHAYTRGLAAAALRAGARIFTQSRARRLSREGARWRVLTPSGAVRARQVVIATDAYTDELWPGLAQSLVPLRAYQLVSEPLSENLRAAILPEGQPLTDTRRLYAGVRLRADGRLHMSVDGPAFSTAGRAKLAKAERRIATLFPQIGALRWDEEWSGWVGMTADHYPHLHRLASDLWAAIGFNGRGIALATLVGRDVARRIAGFSERELFLPVTKLSPIRAHGTLRPFVSALLDWYRLRDAMELRRLPAKS